MTTTVDPDKAAAALSGPPQRSRAPRGDLPKPPGSGPTQAEQAAEAKAKAEQEAAEKVKDDEAAAATAKAKAAADQAEKVTVAPAVSKAKQLLAARTAEQTFLPLVSRVAKLREWVEQADLAVQEALANGVEREALEDTLRSIARKNNVPWNDLPPSITELVATR